MLRQAKDRDNKYKYVLQIQELHNESWFQMRAIKRVINNAEIVFMPEYNRSAIYRVWFKLSESPRILPNKPYFIPSEIELEKLLDKHKNLIKSLERKKVVLYQGIIHPERDLTEYVRAIEQMNNDYVLVILGTDKYGLIDKYRKINSRIVYIDFLPAPDYLAITSISYIGIVTYDPMELNTAFCAPNKVFEYGYFGLPMVGNDIPGLKYTVEKSGAGILISRNDAREIKNAILRIEKDYDKFSENAKLFFDSVDNAQVIKESLEMKNIFAN